MSLVKFELLKQHVRADDFSGDDAYLESLLEAAEEWVVRATNRDATELVLSDGSLPPSLRQAVLLLAGHWYNQREAVAATQMVEAPYTITALIRPYRKLSS